jgi:anti-sigma regulatory factor (Ser/Thr protein kinase)
MALISSEAGASRPGSDTRVAVTEVTQAGEARRVARSLSQEAGFDASFCSDASILVSELATNLARYATAGEILLQIQSDRHDRWLNILAIDRGPGIDNVSRSMADGFSTGGTAGNGLGAVQRLATAFDVYSAHPGGTVVYACLHERGNSTRSRFRWGGVCQPMRHETVSGDMCR